MRREEYASDAAVAYAYIEIILAPVVHFQGLANCPEASLATLVWATLAFSIVKFMSCRKQLLALHALVNSMAGVRQPPTKEEHNVIVNFAP